MVQKCGTDFEFYQTCDFTRFRVTEFFYPDQNIN